MSILNTFDLTGKTAIVTGGGRGLGKGIAEGLCEAGASVVIIGSSNSVINTAKEFTDKGFIAYAIKGDLSNKELIPTIFNEALSKLNGKIDILINNAGIQRRHKCEEFPLSDWEAVLQVNLNTVFMLCQLAGNVMLKQGHGKIINLASMLSFLVDIQFLHTLLAKELLLSLLKHLLMNGLIKILMLMLLLQGI
ncbi:Dehydrogenases with different specificities (related to short-chain alcohol dehydrogenases) [Megamonas hypermegale ART12/1]|nr:Dehydrogenases with different specificities (related to short-chain alcohol dehydrogenases) [Megamonas hypermegale ART12/1]